MISEYTATAFALLNGARILAYAPQIQCLIRENGDAKAVSLVTWTLFTLANAATVTYAIIVLHDMLMAGVFILNLIGCGVIVALIVRKRVQPTPLLAVAGASGTGSTSLQVDSDSVITSVSDLTVLRAKQLFHHLERAWRRNMQRRLDRHLMLTLPGTRMRYRGDDSLPSHADAFRHHPGFRE